ncbi:MAG: FHA domain-containing protein [Arcanobacterium sp.]|nr:FHA domain-containing protein [Arcanobacterium sp.]
MTNREIDLNTGENQVEVWETSRISAVSHNAPEVTVALRGLDGDDIAAISALPIGSAMLIVLSGPNEGARFLLNEDETIAGRKPDTDIFLDDYTVSRHHAAFIRNGTEFSVKDLQSLNGTYVNQDLVDERILSNGDEVRIGKYRLTFCTNH